MKHTITESELDTMITQYIRDNLHVAHTNYTYVRPAHINIVIEVGEEIGAVPESG